MHSALFIVTIPAEEMDWNNFQASVNAKAQHFEGVTRIAMNVWLLDLAKSMTALGYLTAFVENAGFSYGILPFAAEPQWLPGKFRPTSIDESSRVLRNQRR